MFTAVVSANVGHCLVLGVIFALSLLSPSQGQGICEPLTIQLCQGLGYSTTMFPNILEHSSQDTAALELQQFSPLVRMDCSKDLRYFLCSVYAPICSAVSKTPVPPCRSLCDSSKQGCEAVMNRFGFTWLKSLRCDKFPRFGDATCVGWPRTSTQQPPTFQRQKRGKSQLELVQYTLLCRPSIIRESK